MNSLQNWQIRCEEICIGRDKYGFNILFITGRLYKLICHKGYDWEVAYLGIDNPIVLGGYKSVLTSPARKMVVFVRDK
ncbi:hypothetical protein KJ807_05985 [Patescibacteria group bacterium]|nr:hypothetical protein [Patescibacteria group bacterium]